MEGIGMRSLFIVLFSLFSFGISGNEVAKDIPEIEITWETEKGQFNGYRKGTFKNFEDDVFYLKAGSCFGSCPVFEMFLFPNGRLVFVGESFVNKIGSTEIFLPSETFEIVYEKVKELQKINIFCEIYMTDASDQLIIAQKGGNEFSFYYYYGCGGSFERERIVVLLDEIWSLLEVKRWENSSP